MNALPTTQLQSLSVGVGISGTAHSGKTLLAAKLINFFETIGIRDVKFVDNETPADEMVDLQIKAGAIELPEDTATTVFIQEVHSKVSDAKETAAVSIGQELGNRDFEHPTYTRALWRHDVFALNEIDGYREWVIKQIKRDHSAA